MSVFSLKVIPLLNKRHCLLHGGLAPLILLSTGLGGDGEDVGVCDALVVWRCYVVISIF
jgi:hypothetical protein